MKLDTAAPYTACFAIMRRGNQVAFIKRKNTGWMDGFYGLPSGKVERGEKPSTGTIREALEEAGVTIHEDDLKPIFCMYRRSDSELFWIDIFFEISKWEGEPINAEPHMHAELAWIDTNNLPENIIPPIRVALEYIKAGVHYAEYGWED